MIGDPRGMRIPKGSLVDRLIEGALGLVSNRKRRLRIHRRLMESTHPAAEDYQSAFRIYASSRGYAAAKTVDGQTPWQNATDRSADAESVPDLGTLRYRHRALERDESLASGIFREFRRGVVGSGLRPQARCKGSTPEATEAKNAAIEKVGRRLLESAAQQFGLTDGMQQAVEFQGLLESGMVILKPAVAAPGSPVFIECIESDRLATPRDAAPRDPEGRIVGGVEKDRWGRPMAYWVMKRHPGDWSGDAVYGPQAKLPITSLSTADFDRLDVGDPARPRVKLVLSRVTRPGQGLGLGILHACLQDLHDLGLLLGATLKRAQIAACLAMFITSAADDFDLLEMTAADYGYELDQRLKPGAMWRLFPGESVTAVNPSVVSPELDDFVMLLVQRVSSAVGLSAEAIMRRWGQSSYSGARTIKIDDRQTFRLERTHYADQALMFRWRVLLEDALRRGDRDLVAAGVVAEDLEMVDWIGDEEQHVDPKTEADAVEVNVRTGISSRQIEAARLGRDWQDVARQNVAYEKFLAEERKRQGVAAPAAAAPPGARPVGPPTPPSAGLADGSEDKPASPFGRARRRPYKARRVEEAVAA